MARIHVTTDPNESREDRRARLLGYCDDALAILRDHSELVGKCRTRKELFAAIKEKESAAPEIVRARRIRPSLPALFRLL